MAAPRKSPLVWCVIGLVACHPKDSAPEAPTGPRIVSISPSTTEALFAVGAGGELVGRSRFCDTPEAVKALPVVGGYADPSLEAILALRPTLVVGAHGPAGASIADKLAQHGIDTTFPAGESWSDVRTMLLALGERTGHAAEGAAAAARLDADTAAAEAELRRERRPRVLLVLGLAPVVVAGPGSFVDEMSRRAGADNVVTEGGPYPVLTAERVLALAPDVVVDLAMQEEHSAERLRTTLPWSALAAVRAGRVAEVADDAALRPGPRLAQGLRSLGLALRAVEGRP